MPSSPEDASAAQWNYLFDTLTTEKRSGRLTALMDVRQSSQLWTEQLPAAGVQLEKTTFTREGAGSHRLVMTTLFYVVMCAESTPQISGSTEVPANLDVANAAMRALMSDGAGNGLGPVLRDPSNFLLGGNAFETQIVGTDWMPDVGGGETPQILIWTYTRLWAKQLVYG